MSKKRVAVEGDFLVEYEEVIVARTFIPEKEVVLVELQNQKAAFEAKFDLRTPEALKADLAAVAGDQIETAVKSWVTGQARREEHARITKQITELEIWLAGVNSRRG